MCGKYEDLYQHCFDLMVGIDTNERAAVGDWDDDSVAKTLWDWGIAIKDMETYCQEFCELLDRWHERGVVAPRKDYEGVS